MISVIIVLIIAIFLQLFRKYESFNNTPLNIAAENIYGFLDEWAVILGTTIALVFLITTLGAFSSSRRSLNIERIIKWTNNTLEILCMPNFVNSETMGDSSMRLTYLVGDGASQRVIAGKISGKLQERFNKAHKTLGELVEVMHDEKSSPTYINDMRTKLSFELLDIIELASELMQ
ncbi:hypothetical protein ES703_87926 [subsurface metagenome]